jgi:acyl-homoserine lactone acylase PvdQ
VAHVKYRGVWDSRFKATSFPAVGIKSPILGVVIPRTWAVVLDVPVVVLLGVALSVLVILVLGEGGRVFNTHTYTKSKRMNIYMEKH